MGQRTHFPIDGRKVGTLTAHDPRARLARVTLDGVDITRGVGPNKHVIVAANDLEGWIGALDPVTHVIYQLRGAVAITFEPSDGVRAAMKGTTS